VGALALLDGALIRRRRTELALSLRALAAQCGVAAPVITAVENDRNHHDLSIGFVVKLATALALDPAQFILATASHDEGCTDADGASVSPIGTSTDGPGSDAAAVGALLHSTGVLTPVATLSEVLGWPSGSAPRRLSKLSTPSCGVWVYGFIVCRAS
jgi:cytoskeletal protein RodZ